MSPIHRGQGIGTILIAALSDRAEHLGACEMYVTAAATIRDDFEPMIAKAGFERVGTESGRYGCGRDEDIFVKLIY